MSEYQKVSDWGKITEDFIQNGRSVAIGVFDQQGQMLDANRAMCYFMDAGPDNKNPNHCIVNPLLSALYTDKRDGIIFSGILTIGNRKEISYSLEATIYRREDYMLVCAEADVPQLFDENNKMSDLNQQVNNLQRQLIKEKMALQETLKELKETQQMLVHSEKMNAMGKLVAGVAHEVNNPIAYVYSNMFSLEKYIDDLVQSYNELESLVNANSDQKLIGLANEIRKNNDLDFLFNDISDLTQQSKTGIERVKTIVEDLRTFSRLDEAQMKTIDLIGNISSTVAIAGLEFSKRNINYQLDAPEKLMVDCYPGQLNQALLNVIVNSAQSIKSDGKISISVKIDEPNVLITITDNGCGIPETIKSKIFDPFFSTKPVGSGTGLGLSITYKIIKELHKGTIAVDSEEGVGTIFRISIPLKQLIDKKSIFA